MIDPSSIPLPDLLSQLAAFHTEQRQSTHETRRKFYDGNHWQDGAGWIGDWPADSTDGAAAMRLAIQKAFTFENVIKELCDRPLGGVLGDEPIWDWVVKRALAEGEQPTPGEQTITALADAAQTTWWDQQRVLRQYREALLTLLLNGRAPLRAYEVGSRLVDTQGVSRVRRRSLEEALRYQRIRHVKPEAAAVLHDADTESAYSVYLYLKDHKQYAEVSYLDDDQRTILRVVGPDGTISESDPLPLGGHLLVYDLEHPALITDAICALQRSVNLARTKKTRNINMGADRELVILNGEPPSKEEVQPDGTKKRVPAARKRGSGTTNYEMGLAIRDEHGKITSRMNPSFIYTDPVPVETFTKTRDDDYAAMHGQAQQLHALISGDATASGKSREQARAEYAVLLGLLKGELDGALRWGLEVSAHLAATFAGRPGLFLGYRVEANCRVNTGPLSPEERNANREDQAAGLLSKETAMSRNGVDDTAGESERIIKETTNAPLNPLDQARLQREQEAREREAGVPSDLTRLLSGAEG